MSENAPPSVPGSIFPSSEFSTNYTNFMEFKEMTDGIIVIENGYIHNVKDPIFLQDVATKAYVQDNAGGDSSSLKSWKNFVQAATTANIVLSGTLVIDGVSTEVDDRILVKNQNVLSENGIYLVSSGSWNRAIDATTSSPTTASGTAIYVIAGTSNANKVYICGTVAAGPTYNPVLYGDDITFTSFGQSTPGGSTTQVQFNNGGVLDGSSNFVWDGSNVKVLGIKTNTIDSLTTSDVNLYVNHEAPIIVGNVVSPTLSLQELTASGSFTMSNQANNALSLVGTNRVTGTGASISLATGSGSLGGSMYMLTGSSSVGAGPPIILRPGSGSTTQGNVIISPVVQSASISNTSGSLVVFGGIGSTGSITSGGTITGTQILADGRIFVGSSGNVSTPVVMSGDATIVNSGALTLASVTTAGTYATANITVDAKGRVISASNGSGAGPGGASGVLQYNASGTFGGIANFSTNGSDITGGTSAQLYIGNSSNLTGSTGPLSVAGSAYIARSLIIGETLGAKIPLSSGQMLVGSASNLATNASMSGDATISNTAALTLASVVTPGTFTNANISIDAKGRVVVASSGSSGTPGGITGNLQYNNGGVLGGSSNWFYSTSGPSIYSTGAGTSISIGGQGDTSGTPAIFTNGGIIAQKNVLINGNVTGGQNSLTVVGTTLMDNLNVQSGNVNVAKSLIVTGTISGNQLLSSTSLFVGSTEGYAVGRTMTGDASISSVGALSLASVITAGTFTNANISVDAKGRVVVASNGSNTGTPGGISGNLQYNNTGVFAGTNSWSFSTTNPSGVVSNTLVSTGNSSLYIGSTGSWETTVPSIYSKGGILLEKGLQLGTSGTPYAPNALSFQVASGYSTFNDSVRVGATGDSADSFPALWAGNGGLYVGKSATIVGSGTFLGPLNVASTVASVSPTTGALLVTGGAGISGNTNILGNLGVTGTSQFTSIGLSGNANITGNLTVGGTISGNQVLSSGSIFVGSTAGYAVARTMDGDASINSNGDLTLSSVITSGTVTNANISFDSKGRITNASSGVSSVPGGISGNLQYNNAGALGGTTSWNFSSTNPLNNVVSNTLYSTSNSSLYVGGTGDSGSNTPSIYTGGGISVAKGITISGTSSLSALSVTGPTNITGTTTLSSLIVSGTSSLSAVTVSGNVNITSTVDGSLSVSYLVVGGGGGGGGGGTGTQSGAGGGGAGGILSGTALLASCTIVVGTGGAGAPGTTSAANGSSGTSSSIPGITAIGGGGGGARGTNGVTGASGGGSGGGAVTTGGIGTQGFNGGVGSSSVGDGAGGGGGSSQIGATTAGITGGAGGNGTSSSISGSSVTYAGGGGGGATGTGGAGGSGGGGSGGNAGTNATGFGSGGGGAFSNTAAGGNGSSGIVIISYAGTQIATGGTITSSGGNTIHTFTSSGTFVITTPSVTIAGGIYATKSITTSGNMVINSTTASTSTTTGALVVAGGAGIGGKLLQNLSCYINQVGGLNTFNDITVTSVIFNGAGTYTTTDPSSMHSTSTNNTRITVPVAGNYIATGFIRYTDGTGGGMAGIYKNGSTYAESWTVTGTGIGFRLGITVSTFLTLAANDYIELMGYQSTGGSTPNTPTSATLWLQCVG